MPSHVDLLYVWCANYTDEIATRTLSMPTCQVDGVYSCDEPATWMVQYVDPEERVYYCTTHAIEKRASENAVDADPL